MPVSVITPPTAFPVTAAEVKTWCRIDGTAQDAEVDGLIAAATSYVEDYTGRALMTQTLKLSLDAFTDSIELSRGPVQSVTSVVYDDPDGVQQTLSADDYTVDLTSDPQWLVRNSDSSWPTIIDAVNAVRITYVAGYSTLPPAIKQAIMFLISQWNDNRTPFSERVPTELPNTVAALLVNHRSFGF